EVMDICPDVGRNHPGKEEQADHSLRRAAGPRNRGKSSQRKIDRPNRAVANVDAEWNEKSKQARCREKQYEAEHTEPTPIGNSEPEIDGKESGEGDARQGAAITTENQEERFCIRPSCRKEALSERVNEIVVAPFRK